MKKICCIIYLFILIFPLCHAQEISKLGDISKEEIALKECDFDKEASSVILIHEANAGYDDLGQLITVHHIRIKILKDAGLDQANVSLQFYRKDDFERIDKVDGLTINIGQAGELVKDKIDKNTVYSKPINTRLGEVIFAFPAVKVGSIIDYKYRSTMKNYAGLDYWDFQDESPVVISKYKLDILPGTEFAYRINKRRDLDVVVNNDPTHGSVYFEMKNIPGLREEAYMDARKDYLQKVIFQLSGYKSHDADKNEFMTSWEAVNTELLKYDEFGEQLKKNVRIDELTSMLSSLNTAAEKMNVVYNYVRRNMTWNSIYSKFSNDGIKAAWKKKTGTSGDINLLLVNLLKDAGLEAYPVLVSERFHGKVNTDYPFIDQFNSVFACVKINSRNYFLDATDPYTPSHITPYDILNTTGFIVKKQSGELINISNDSLQYKEVVSNMMEVKEDGTVNGNIVVQSEDYARIEKLETNAKEKENLKNSYFYNEGFPMDITSFKIKNRDKDSLPLEQEFEFSSQLISSGEYKYIPLNFLPGFKKNPFISDNRFSNINFGYSRNIILSTSIQLPASMVPDNLPRSVKMITPDNNFSFRRYLVYDSINHTVTCTLNLVFKTSLVDADDYATLKAIYKNIYGYLKEPVLLKKK